MIKCCQEIKKSIYFFHFQAVCIGICAYMHTTFLVGEIADRFQFSKRLDFENAQNVRGVEILRHRAGLLCRVKVVKLYYDWSKSPFPSKVDKKNLLPRFFVNNKMIPPLTSLKWPVTFSLSVQLCCKMIWLTTGRAWFYNQSWS